MSEAWALMLAVAAAAGAIAGADGHLPAAVGGVTVAGAMGLMVAGGVATAALAARRPAWLCLGVALLAGVLAQRSVAGLAPPPTGPARGEVTLVSDPEPDGRGGVAMDVRLDGRRLRAFARASAAAALDDRLAGERVAIVGRVQRPGPWERLLRHRHLAGRLDVETVTGWRPGGTVSQAANGLRRTLASGAEGLPARQQSLLAGLTLGDDRAQPPDMADAFEAAGLTHLLAVSGQNVAFALLIASPVLARLRFGPRLGATLAVLAGFALLTRFEPSVLRATAMAGVAATGTAFGRPSSSRRALGLGVAGMVLVDPMLATSLGFQLSAAATAGIVLGAGPIERALPGPRWLAAPLSLTIAAQLAVSPLLVATFGPLPVASLPANVLAGPAAGPVMVWGLTGGLVAGLVGGPLAAALHLPTRLMLTWLEGVAVAATRLPLGSLAPAHLALAAIGLALLLATHPRLTPSTEGPTLGGASAFGAAGRSVPGGGPAASGGAALGAAGRSVPGGGPAASGGAAPATGLVAVVAGRSSGGGAPGRCVRGQGTWARRAGVGLVVAALVGAAWPRPPATGPVELGAGATAWRGREASVLVADGRAHAETVLGGLRQAGVGNLDAVVFRSNARSTAELLAVLRRRWPRVNVVAPPADDGRAPPVGAVTVPTATTVAVGDLAVVITPATPGHIDVDVTLGHRAGRRRGGPAVTDVVAGQPMASPRVGWAEPARWAGARAIGSAGGWTGPVPVTVGPIEAIELRGAVVDLRTRALVAAVVPAPRFGREGEVAAGVQRAADNHADLADVSLEPRLVGPVARGPLPVCARAGDLATVRAARAAGAALVMVAPDLAAESADAAHPEAAGVTMPIAVVVDDVAQLAEARGWADRLGMPLALDATRRVGADAMAQEAAAIAGGCRLVRTTDVRRTRRVVEVMAALLEARR